MLGRLARMKKERNMSQGARSNRHASLDDKKTRAAGRAKRNIQSEIRESLGAPPRRQVSGAFGASGENKDRQK